MSRSAWLLPAFVAAACQTYEPAPVDLSAHARAFAARLPDADAVRAFAERLASHDPVGTGFDLRDGLALGEARFVALLTNPSLRAVRAESGVAAALAEFAGRWADPQLSGSFFYVLESMYQYPWFAGAYVAQTLPITGLPGLEQALATSQHARALLAVRVAEANLLNELERAWAQLWAATQRCLVLDDLVQRLGELERIAASLAATNVLTRLEARVFVLAGVRAAAERTAARGEAEVAALRVRELLGLPPESALEFVPSVELADRVAPAAQRDGLQHGPLVAAAQQTHTVAERELQLAVRRQWPELWIQPGWQEEDAEPRPAFGFALPIPLWNGNVQEIAAARARRTVAAEQLVLQLETATHTLVQASTRHRAAAAQRELLERDLLPRVAEHLADGRRLVELGQLDTLLLLDAVTRASDAQLAVIAATLAEAEALVARNSLFWPALVPPVEED
ncbi:MAG: TolC family protein [Planctomycetota bacterium]